MNLQFHGLPWALLYNIFSVSRSSTNGKGLGLMLTYGNIDGGYQITSRLDLKAQTARSDKREPRPRRANAGVLDHIVSQRKVRALPLIPEFERAEAQSHNNFIRITPEHFNELGPPRERKILDSEDH